MAAAQEEKEDVVNPTSLTLQRQLSENGRKLLSAALEKSEDDAQTKARPNLRNTTRAGAELSAGGNSTAPGKARKAPPVTTEKEKAAQELRTAMESGEAHNLNLAVERAYRCGVDDDLLLEALAIEQTFPYYKFRPETGGGGPYGLLSWNWRAEYGYYWGGTDRARSICAAQQRRAENRRKAGKPREFQAREKSPPKFRPGNPGGHAGASALFPPPPRAFGPRAGNPGAYGGQFQHR